MISSQGASMKQWSRCPNKKSGKAVNCVEKGELECNFIQRDQEAKESNEKEALGYVQVLPFPLPA